MNVIVIGQSKGGVGKTTIAINLANEIISVGRSATVIDADPQESALQWAELRRLSFNVKAVSFDENKMHLWTRDVLRSNNDFVIIDLPAGLGCVFDMAVHLADLLVIPCGPSSIDIEAAKRTISRAQDIRRIDPRAASKIVTVPSRIDVGSEEGAQIVDVLADLGEAVAPGLSFYSQHQRAFTEGIPVAEMTKSEHASEEIRSTALFLLKVILPRHTFKRT